MRRLTTVSLAAALGLLAQPSAAQDKYALSMFHFNLQYVAGGMVGFGVEDPKVDLDNDEVEDLIVTESFAPVVALYDKHPNWGVTLELQGYMLDVLAARHPSVLDDLRKLAKAGRAEVVSCHYSDLLYLAYPADVWKKSQDLTAATFKRHDVPLGSSLFCQEGQSGMGLGSVMKPRGYQTMVWPKNLWSFQHGDFDAQPLYDFGDVLMIAGAKDVNFDDGTTNVQVRWTFFDDGELLATNDWNPYILENFKHDPAAVKKYEDKVADLENQGFAISTVQDYVAAVKDRVPHATPPPLLDGTWQTPSHNVSKWLGTRGLWPGERDNDVRTLGAIAYRELTAAEAAVKSAGLDARAKLDSAWRMLALGMVTDASGINPFRGEIEYGIAHEAEALRIAREVIGDAKREAGMSRVCVAPAKDSMSAGQCSSTLTGQASDALVNIDVFSGDRTSESRWEKLDANTYRVVIDFGVSDSGQMEISATVPGKLEDELVTTRALEDDAPFTYKRSDFTFEEFHLPTPTGLVSLGGGRFLVLDQAYARLAPRITRDSGDVVLRDQSQNDEEPVTWVFYVYEGTAAEALALAHEVNVKREVSR
ncbi:MAG: hypothetical protein R3B13_18700 [Polyangiaceae bacterium]